MSEISPQIKNSIPSPTATLAKTRLQVKRKLSKQKRRKPKKPKKSVDLLIVLGQGPVKPLLLEKDLSPQQREHWEKFKQDPLHYADESDKERPRYEPDFRVVEGPFARELAGLDESQIEAKLIEWQQMGRFGLNRWGRENALAAGFALVSGYTDRLLLSGGKNKANLGRGKTFSNTFGCLAVRSAVNGRRH